MTTGTEWRGKFDEDDTDIAAGSTVTVVPLLLSHR